MTEPVELMSDDEIAVVVNQMDDGMMCVFFDEEADLHDDHGWTVCYLDGHERFVLRRDAIGLCEEVGAEYIVLPSVYTC